MATLEKIKASTMIENLVAMTIVALAVGCFFQVMGMLQAEANKTELKNRALTDIDKIFSQYEKALPKQDTLLLFDAYEIQLDLEIPQEEGVLRLKAIAKSLAGEDLLERVRYYGKN